MQQVCTMKLNFYLKMKCMLGVIFFFALQVKSSEKASLLLAQSLI